MIFVPRTYIEVLKRRDFFVLILMILFGQLATAFLILSLIVSVFEKTGSTFAVSGVILSLTVPAFLLMAVAGLAADIIDRKKIMVVAYSLIAIVVFLILVLQHSVAASLPLSFLYFAGNTFFIPSSSAATAQLVKKGQFLAANSIFIFTLSAALLIGFFFASFIQFFFGSATTLVVCLFLLVISIILGLTLPQLKPVTYNHPSVLKNIQNIISGFKLIMSSKEVWYFFVIFALIQGLILFGVTLAPGFFNDIARITIDRSPIIVMPLVGLGVIIGSWFVHKPSMGAGFLVTFGLSIIGLFSAILGLILKVNLVYTNVILLIAIYLILVGFGAVLTLIASRTAIQQKVPHKNLGIVFGASMILTSFMAAVFSTSAAFLEAAFGYINILIYGGLLFLVLSAIYAYLGNRWKY
ncbi:hypothetical protein A3J17_00730 [Candidatus Curtissbacteria bacterium RIFCSPLOWO2_02_FULL_40_11]|uniref:Major facilitator superfamily (MFS) profile domain-containing protein n=2 Tax=Candidatus Curtissiibacteriota TaxID=1752717 RepID=A0A1F5GBK5_9BACT|nr:MAG: hypothetical protein A3D04_01205 [Candidatus Curtissbacteria bacterium RIFCSPHIGHO2_02_FULL_40_16b]OGD99312.1 MAG: hypothetical protein A3J17_00730 [Candidatus Curtissbacteria bacterium RIFCSPLOWO2_02_FULL_40_11]OGE12978.1 MAG: hypothetical protein A3G14_03510 [Candidatus Curtissbacteria bacterium RIFCSPLOWO2_12_FULL_38_9]